MNKKILILSISAIMILFSGTAFAENCTSNVFLENIDVSSNYPISETSLVNSQKTFENSTNEEKSFSLIDNMEEYSYETLKTENNKYEISTKDIELYYNNGTRFTATVNENISNQEVTFEINGVIYSRVADYHGTANLNLNLNPRTYNVKTTYGSTVANNTVTILSTIDAHDLVKYHKNSTQFNAKFLDNNGKPLKNVKVSFYLNEVEYHRFTDGQGIAILNINLNSGNYTLISVNPLNNERKLSKITILSTVNGTDISKYYRNSTQYSVRFKDSTGNPLSDVNVTFNINGVHYTKSTNSIGEAQLNINLDPGNYIVTATNPSSNESISNRIQVLKAKTFLMGFNVQSSSLNTNFSVNLFYENNAPIQNQRINFKIGNRTYDAITMEDGTATIQLDNLEMGKNIIKYEFAGDSGFFSSADYKTVTALNSKLNFESNDMIMEYGDESSFEVTLKDENNHPIENRNIIFSVNGIDYNRITDENGKASLNVNLNPGKYNIDYHSSNGSEIDVLGYNEIIVNKKTAVLNVEDLVMNYQDGSKFKVFVTSPNGTPISDLAIKFNVSGRQYIKTTDSNGIAALNINLLVGFYSISYSLEDNLIFEDVYGNAHVLVNGSKMFSEAVYGLTNSVITFKVKLVDAFEKPIPNAIIRFYTNTGKSFIQVTDSNGIAAIDISGLKAGTYQVAYYHSSSTGNVSGMNYVYVKQAISIDSLIIASRNVKNYIESNYKLPLTVTISNEKYSMPQFLYLVALAISNINANDFSQISTIDVGSPNKPLKTLSLGNLYGYASLSKSVIDYISNNKIAPNSMYSDVGEIGYDSLVYALTRVLAYYGDHNAMPLYTAIKPVEAPAKTGPLDSLNTISDLTNYLKASKNCQKDNAAIKSLANSLTSKLSSDYDKANAIFNYVKSCISYSYYYNSKYGASGTLNYKTGNCCDQAHLIVALCRASGIPARYVHGTCKFSSGNVYGHVWSQILINNVWVVADPTSSKNSLGTVNNWNPNNYILHGYYSSLNF